MSKTKSTAKLVITSVILSLIVLAIFTLVFLRYIVPVYQITEKQVYDVLVKLFPILVGLVLIQIGIIAGKRNEDDYRDQMDRLPPNAYSVTYEGKPKDDPSDVSPTSVSLTKEQVIVEKPVEVVKEVPVEVVKEVVREVPVEVVKEVPVEVIRDVVREVPVEVLRDVVKEVEVPVEVLKEVPVEIVREVVKEVEVPVEVVKEVPVEVIREVEVPVEIVKEVPVEVIKEVPVEVIREVEKPVEVVKEVPVEVVKEVEKEIPEEYLGLEETLDKEIAFSREMFTDLTVAAVAKENGVTEEKLSLTLGQNAFIFESDNAFILIFSFANENETAELIKAQEFNVGAIRYGLASLKDSSTASSMIKEAESQL